MRKQQHAWTVALRRFARGGGVSATEYSEYRAVIASNIEEACRKGIRQAREDSGYTQGWVVVKAERGDWVVA
jgi:hypothetical protein